MPQDAPSQQQQQTPAPPQKPIHSLQPRASSRPPLSSSSSSSSLLSSTKRPLSARDIATMKLFQQTQLDPPKSERTPLCRSVGIAIQRSHLDRDVAADQDQSQDRRAPFRRSHSKPENPTSNMGARAIEESSRATAHNNGKKLIFMRNFSVSEEDVVVCNRVRSGVNPTTLRQRSAQDRRYLRSLSVEESRLTATRRRANASNTASPEQHEKRKKTFAVREDELFTMTTIEPTSDALKAISRSASNSGLLVSPRKISSPRNHVEAALLQKSSSSKHINTSNLPEEKPESDVRLDSSKLTPREKAMHGRYLIRESFANGSYGKVCAGEAVASHQEVAVKIVPKYVLISPEEKQSVIREQIIHKSLDHPHIIKLIDVFEDEGAHYFILERADNGSLSTIISYSGLPETRCREVFKQLLLALEYLHRNNIVHHDIKPHNILLKKGNGIKLCDFGASRAFNKNETSLPFAGVFGTPGSGAADGRRDLRARDRHVQRGRAALRDGLRLRAVLPAEQLHVHAARVPAQLDRVSAGEAPVGQAAASRPGHAADGEPGAGPPVGNARRKRSLGAKFARHVSEKPRDPQSRLVTNRGVFSNQPASIESASRLSMLPSSLDLEAIHADRERRRDAVRDRHRGADEDPRPAERPADLQRKREPHEPERRDEREVRRLVLLEHRLRASWKLPILIVKGLEMRLFAREPRFHPRRELLFVAGRPFRHVADGDSLDVEVDHARQAAREQRLLGRTLVRSVVDVEHRHVVHGTQIGAQQREHERPAGRARVERVLARLQPVLLGERSALGDVLDAQVRALREDQVRRLWLARGQERQQLLQVHLVVHPLALQEDEHKVLHCPAEDRDLAQRSLEHDADLVERARTQQHAPEQHPVDARAVVREPERALASRHRGLLHLRGGVAPHAHLDAEELLEQERHVAHPHPLSIVHPQQERWYSHEARDAAVDAPRLRPERLRKRQQQQQEARREQQQHARPAREHERAEKRRPGERHATTVSHAAGVLVFSFGSGSGLGSLAVFSAE